MIRNLQSSKRFLTKLAYVSDLHLEHKKWKNKYPKIDTSSLENEYNLGNEILGIGLLGDIETLKKLITEFLAECSSLFENVLLTVG